MFAPNAAILYHFQITHESIQSRMVCGSDDEVFRYECAHVYEKLHQNGDANDQ